MWVAANDTIWCKLHVPGPSDGAFPDLPGEESSKRSGPVPTIFWMAPDQPKEVDALADRKYHKRRGESALKVIEPIRMLFARRRKAPWRRSRMDRSLASESDRLRIIYEGY